MSIRCRTALLLWILLIWPVVGTMAQAPEGPVVGNLDSIGSDTMAGLMLRWGERLEERHPAVRLQMQASGSSTAPAALAEGTTRLGAMSRRMTTSERETFEAHHGYPPVEIPVAMDALAVFVNRHNPLDEVSMKQLDAIFSDTHDCGAKRSIDRWEALGTPDFAGPIDRHSRNSVSGSYGVFRREALCGGNFRVDVNEHPGSSAVVAAVAATTGGIGYSGIGYVTVAVKPLALRKGDGPAVSPSERATLSGEYPLSRTLYLYVNLPPGERLPATEHAFLDLVLSPEGQDGVRESGFIPLPDMVIAAIRQAMGLNRPWGEGSS
ncbi:PstS family phosphate ABC transporter substrate-binding protein [Aidingimonas halophila]|uniref:Phosphate ABC transporter substrate-binding protein, PhoT family n=1 Tax=Aidingimonas halophila TaxID=574349 RepID=A0A1H2XEB0_9GAMM|nr:substrate-binding domain-containing protein [Aidingimonas halophila]GHC28583.1 phosphate-binding protein [Aidingimonas halophila]SDW91096.1 phosphate ABC transporter substrate-binding protein, PhoT family [Aidingimonas halophila]